MASSDSFRFKSERFDYSSELPDDYNAGNRFYGKDVAEFLKDQMALDGIPADYCDEDWGWMVTGTTSDGLVLMISIYNLSEHMDGGRPGAPEWGLSIQSFVRKRLLGFLPRPIQTIVPPAHSDLVRHILERNDFPCERWPEGSSARST